MKNIVLIGMPGSGKTTVGTLLARRLARPLVDTDFLVEQAAGCTIPALFSAWGEADFRRRETEAVRQAAALKGVIISTGGGVILRPENMEALAQTGLIFFLDRPPEALARVNHAGRPLLADRQNGVAALYTSRIALYRKYAQYTISAPPSPEAAVAQLLQIITESGVFHEVSCD